MTQTETTLDLIIRALRLEDENRETVQGYLEHYAIIKEMERAAVTSARELLINKNPAPASFVYEPAAQKSKSHFNEDAATKKQKASAFSGAGSDVKKAAFARLKAFREKNGLGCYAKIAEAAAGQLSEAEIHEMLDATPYDIAKWRALASALDKLDGIL